MTGASTVDAAAAGPPAPVSTGRRVPLVVGGAIAGAWLAAIGWRVRRSLDLVLAPPDEPRWCPAIYPAPPECSPDWHLSIAAIGAGGILLAYAAVIVISWRVQRWRRPAILLAVAVLTVVGAVGFLVTDDPNRYLLRPF